MALESGRARAEASGHKGIMSTARRSTGDDRTVGFRRSPSGQPCKWCLVVSTQRYHTAESADFGHDNCSCGVIPIIGETDPGRIVNRDLYESLSADGSIDEVSRQRDVTRRAPRLRRQAVNARQRAEAARGEALAETDPARRAVLEERAQRWERRAALHTSNLQSISA